MKVGKSSPHEQGEAVCLQFTSYKRKSAQNKTKKILNEKDTPSAAIMGFTVEIFSKKTRETPLGPDQPRPVRPFTFTQTW